MHGRSEILRNTINAALSLTAVAACATALGANPTHSFNFSGAGASDIGIYRDGQFWYFQGSPANLVSFSLGQAGDVPVPADFDGDGRTDYALYNPDTRTFTWSRSSDGVTGSVTVGDWGDLPVVGDFDGDGKTDVAIYRPADGLFWYTNSSNGQLVDVPIGVVGGLPVVADFEGDRRDELAAFDPTTATFTFWTLGNANLVNVKLAPPGDKPGTTPVIGDYDGDGKADLGVYDSVTSTFTYRRSSDNQTVTVQFGQHGDTPIVGDYDGDGKSDIAVFRPQAGSFNIILYRSSATLQTVTFNVGNPGDIPLGTRYAPRALSSGLTYSNLPGAAQTMYQSGVPHTDKNGTRQNVFNTASFLPRCVVGVQTGVELTYLGTSGFNCFIPWEGEQIGAPLLWSNPSGMQMVQDVELPTRIFAPTTSYVTNPDCNLATNAQNPICDTRARIQQLVAPAPPAMPTQGVLAWKAEDEPSSCGSDCAQRIAIYNGLQTAIGQVDSVHPVFNVDNSAPATGSTGEWSLWNTISPVASNDNYPVGTGGLGNLEGSATGYVALGAINGYSHPVWIMPQAFSGGAGNFVWSMPSAAQLRAEVFTALVHGATGIFYFILDNAIARGNNVIGIAPDPQLDYCPPPQPAPAPPCTWLKATSADLAVSQDLWIHTVELNAELIRLQSAILSPTATSTYQVGYQGTSNLATPIRTMLKVNAAGVYTLLMINIDSVPLNTQVTLPTRPVDLYKIDIAGGRHPLTSNGNIVSDSIDGFGVTIYEFK
jgi:hypothetical protein